MDPSLLRERLEAADRTFHALERQLADPAVAADPNELRRLSKERARLEPLATGLSQWQGLLQQQQDAQQLARQSKGETEMEALIQEELDQLSGQLGELEQ
jgi:peptide chain release factor 1